MTPLPVGWTCRVHDSLASIGREDWTACIGGAKTHRSVNDIRKPPDSDSSVRQQVAEALQPGSQAVESDPAGIESISQHPESSHQQADSFSQEPSVNPFISFDFLHALEVTDCVGDAAGWQPLHHGLHDAGGRLVAAVPAYLKRHSQGEYVFDHGWAEAFMRAGGRYYPKIQIAVPFTPATGPRLLVAADIDRDMAIAALATGLEETRRRLGASSIHATFLTAPDCDALAGHDYLVRHDRQFHWTNEGYATFDDFLAALAARKRKMIRRERKDALAQGLTIRWVTGSDIREHHWDAFFAFYMETGSRKWGRPYLNRAFFNAIGAAMADRIVLIFAERAGRPIAGAINFIGGNTLFGRNWGAIEHHPFLHFEVCYYQAMEFAIARGLARVEAGAQGEHKLLRGYRPVITRSAHSIAHAGLRRAVTDFLDEERRHVAIEANELDSWVPFRNTR